MKHLFISLSIVATALLFNSCFKAETVSLNTDDNIRAVEFGYHGHDYIAFNIKENLGNDFIWHTGIVHNPDCHCFKDSIK